MKRQFLFFTVIVLIVMTVMCFIIPNYTYAEDLELGNLDDYKGESDNPKTVSTRVGKILGVIQTIGTIVSVIMLIVIGIKYMVGSIEERAEYKKTLFPYLIGAILLFSGTLLPQIIYNIMTKDF